MIASDDVSSSSLSDAEGWFRGVAGAASSVVGLASLLVWTLDVGVGVGIVVGRSSSVVVTRACGGMRAGVACSR